jgi:hypothetical protein
MSERAGADPHSPPKAPNRWLTRGVLGLGLGSLFSDWGHETATAILPAFLASIGAPPVALGIIEGVSDGIASFAKLAGGWIADRPRLRKPSAVAGYVIIGFSTFAYALANSWPAILVTRSLGWVGRASSPSRSALLADAVAPEQQGRAFGFERALDTIGAVLGPLCATLLLSVLSLRAIFRWTLLPCLMAALVFAILVPPGHSEGTRRAPSFVSSFGQLPKTYWHYLTGVFAHGIGDFAPTLLILRAGQILTPRFGFARASAIAVALYTFFNVVNAAASYPIAWASAACWPWATCWRWWRSPVLFLSRQRFRCWRFYLASPEFTMRRSNRWRNRWRRRYCRRMCAVRDLGCWRR